MTKITLEFDPLDPASVTAAARMVSAFTGGTPVETAEPGTSAEDADKKAEEEEKKAAAAAKRKETAAKKKAEEEARKKAEEEAAAAATKGDDSGIDDEPDEDAPTYTREQVRKALKDYSALEGKDAAIGILKDHGASSMSELKDEDFASVMKAVDG